MPRDYRFSPSLIPFLLAFALVAASGCVDPGTEPASTKRIAGGALKVIVVGLYHDRVTRSQADPPNTVTTFCDLSDWRVTFTTKFTNANGTYVYDSKATTEDSVKTNDTSLLAKLNETMHSGVPAILTWETFADRGCEYEHPRVAIDVIPVSAEQH